MKCKTSQKQKSTERIIYIINNLKVARINKITAVISNQSFLQCVLFIVEIMLSKFFNFGLLRLCR